MIRRDDQLRLDNDQKPAIEWRDGYRLHFIHGEYFEEPLWKKIVSQKMTVKDVMAMENADQRVMAWSMLRPNRALKGLGAEHIHTGIKGTKLYKVTNFATKIAGDNTEYEGDGVEYCMVMECEY